MDKRIVIMAGGTGGHVFPALAVAQYLLAKNWQVSWMGTQNGLENKVVPAQNIEIDWLDIKGFRGKGGTAKINSLILLLKACWQAMNILRQRKPDVVLGMGGYVAGPGGIMASLMRIPLIIHEQNRIPGTTNRLLKNRANKVLEAFPESFDKNTHALFTGNPLRSDFINFPEKEVWDESIGRPFRLLVVGGSLGAKILNEIVPISLAKLENIEVMHQTGTASLEQVKQKYSALSIDAQLVAFIDDIAAAYQWADMVICRSGAMTVSEVAVAGIPAILIPLPHAIDDHQTANAKYLSECGAAILLAQNELTDETLLFAINKLKKSLKKMSKAAKKQAKPEATRLVAEICEQEAIH